MRWPTFHRLTLHKQRPSLVEKIGAHNLTICLNWFDLIPFWQFPFWLWHNFCNVCMLIWCMFEWLVDFRFWHNFLTNIILWMIVYQFIGHRVVQGSLSVQLHAKTNNTQNYNFLIILTTYEITLLHDIY